MIDDFTPLAGDRKFAEDAAIVGGLGRFRGQPICLIGHEKGDDTASRLKHNFGMARPEGYRKAARLMELADRFDLPVVSLVDTAGAWPGVDAEERGQAEAIARATDVSLSLGTPNVAVVVGEGGSGGALAIAACNKVLMLEHAIYTVASPEAAASILWRDSSRAQDAATSMKITAQDLLKFGIIDAIVPEPIGGAHRDPAGGGRGDGARRRRRPRSAQQHVARSVARRAGAEVSRHGPQALNARSARRRRRAATVKGLARLRGPNRADGLSASDRLSRNSLRGMINCTIGGRGCSRSASPWRRARSRRGARTRSKRIPGGR